MTLPFKFALITSCSSSRTVQPIARVGKIPPGQTMQTALDNWAEQLKVPDDKLITPGELYRGLGFATIAKIQEQYKPNDIRIVTGGQGLIALDERIVPYDFTAAKNEPENIWQAVTAEPFVQTAWWRMINTLRGKSPTPIADFVKNTSYDLYLISMGKVFVRYIAEDVLISGDVKHIRILLAASSMGSVPAQLRPYIIPFDRDVIMHMPGNRNDTNHRAAQFFLQLCEQDPNFVNLPIEVQRAKFASTTGPTVHAKLDLSTLFAERPELLTLDVDIAYRIVRREHGTFGGKMHFRSAWRQAKGLDIERPVDIDMDESAAAMAGLSFLNASGQQASSSEEDIVLGHIQVFVDTLKRVAPTAAFTAADVVSWAKNYFKGIPPVATILQPNKLAFILKSNFSLLGLEETDVSGAKSYTCRPTPVETETETPTV